ncbi:PAS domain S-box protein [Paenibacillus sp. HWE-109]|uniref:PAS domain-containing protein n=1 Tax=Paenibacillus sp. HWE-109 TaxID=1306526 RepID=UPI001EE149F7|nr:PAS domain S-box protein [Paenibacillus sp. HWE-109]UKS26481.1 PAS domain S-box protein [Paenibacillus sp. HWE-109]
MSIDHRLANESLFKQAFKYAPIGMALVHLNGDMLETNPAICSLLGYSEAELITMTFHDITHPEDLELDCLYLSELLACQRETYQLVKRYLHKEGHVIRALLAVSLVKDEDHNPQFLIAQVIDQTDHKHIESCLEEKERMRMMSKLEEIRALSLIISENVLDIITIATPDCITRYISPAVRRLLGYEPEEMVGTKLTTLWHPDDLEDFLQRGLFKDGDVDILECRIRHNEGHYVWFETRVKMICDEQGIVAQVVGIGRDITMRKQAEAELRATKERLESFIDHNIDPVMMINLAYDVVKINLAFEKTFGWTSPEIVGVNVFNFPFIPEASRPGCLQALEQRQPYYLETIRKKKDGGELPVMVSLFTMRDESGIHSGWAVTLRDLTAHKQTEALLINSEKLTIAGQLAAGIAHEIRNPITAIKGFMHLMRSGKSEKQMYYDIVSSEIERIEMILSELLILAKPQLIHSECKDLRALLNQVTTLLESQANMNNVQILMDFEPCNTYVQCDENQLKQVCINFIKNAIEAMPHGGDLFIHLKSNHTDRILLRFIDHGCGVPEQILAKLGQPFFTTKEKGTGLGFMVSKKIIENHHGTVTVISTENKGTTVEVSLPTVPKNRTN